jgi:ABC-type multidrug transport system fused ATPase/permease subunit
MKDAMGSSEFSVKDFRTYASNLYFVKALLNETKKRTPKDKTTIIVSHRVSSAKNADKIIIIEEGQIIQEGSHNQLVNQEGYYAELYVKQLSEKELN